MTNLDTAAEKFKSLMNQQLKRIEHLKKTSKWVDYSTKPLLLVFAQAMALENLFHTKHNAYLNTHYKKISKLENHHQNN